MRRGWKIMAAVLSIAMSSAAPAHAIHLYRGSGGGCTPADGTITDDPQGTQTGPETTVVVGHNQYSTGVSGLGIDGFTDASIVTIKVGDTVHWTWNSSHCHSVTSSTLVGNKPLFDSGFHYPTVPPESPQVAPGVFDYPILDDSPTLGYTRTFTAPGDYPYYCVHHVAIGMKGVIRVVA